MRTSQAIVALTLGFSPIILAGQVPAKEFAQQDQATAQSLQERKIRELNSIHNRLSALPQASQSVSLKAEEAEEAKKVNKNADAIVTLSVRSESKKTRAPSTNQKTGVAKLRSKSPEKSSSAFGFSIFSADSILNYDLDGDGYYSDFTIDFDADFDNGAADVYGVIYYSVDGGDWTELTETDVFSIYSDLATDSYSVSTQLNFGFPSNDYDILIDLYEDGLAGIVATISSDDVDSLYALPLEDEEHEVSISYVESDLFGDADGDGFYTDLTLEYDINSQLSGEVVYAEIVLTNVVGGWEQTVSTSDFVLGNNTEFVDLTFNAGYPPGWYDVTIYLVNSQTGEVIVDVGPEFSSLKSLPIESINNDNFNDSIIDNEIHVSGGGSVGWGFLLLSALGLLRQKQAKR